MHIAMKRRALALVCALAAAVASARDTVYVESEGPRPWYTMLRPARRTPAEQLEYARGLRDRGSLRRAHRHYRALVASWPSSPEAPVAQLEHARLLDARGRSEEAFEAYQQLMEKFPGSFPFDEAYQRQTAIAQELLERKRWGVFSTPERAIPLLEKAVANAPTRADAARARLTLGRAHRQNDDPAKAAAVFAEIERLYPDDPAAEEAAFQRAECLDEIFRAAPRNSRLIEEAWIAYDRFVRRYPDSPRAELARERRDQRRRSLAQRAWEEARFYDRRGGRPSAAIGPYERFLERYADTEWADAARARLEQLRAARKPPEGDSP